MDKAKPDPSTHRDLFGFCALAIALSLTFGATKAQADQKFDDALKRASAFLLSRQTPTGTFAPNHAMPLTSLSVLALAACGHQPVDPSPEGQAMRKGLDFILLPENQTPAGYFGQLDNSRMYGHGITTLMLAEMLGMGLDEKQDTLIRQKCQSAINLILRAQRLRKDPLNDGGWRYEPSSPDSDMSITVWQTMALRAAQNAGMDIPREPVDKAVAYMKKLFHASPNHKGPDAVGGFGYSAPGGAISTTAEGLLAMQVCGQYQAPETIAAGNALLLADVRSERRYFFYTIYYYAQGMYQRGGKFAEAGKRNVEGILLPMQLPEGSWQGVDGTEQGPGKVYCTSMAVLALAVKNHFLPIYQR